ncbi:MAG: Aspartokinase [Chlamydiae bacterium]|nr:Aspartokinase [Chlamydiota bacterium]
MKFGGASVATPQHFSRIANLILERKEEHDHIVIVVSAMGDTTDQLIALAKKVHPEPPRREYDMLVTVGERISISLLAMALARKNQEAMSFTGSQSGVITSEDHTDARIIDVRPHRLVKSLDQGKVVIVAGFQGVSTNGEITTLGRGGSDTSAVALGAALSASAVEFYKDVPGVFEEDPKSNPNSRFLRQLSYQAALEIVRGGAKILHPRCISLARENQIPLVVKSFCGESCDDFEGTVIRDTDGVRPHRAFFEQEQVAD